MKTAELVVRSVPVTERICYDYGKYFHVPDYWRRFMEYFTHDMAPGFPTTAHLFSREINEYLLPYNARLIEDGYASYTLIFESQRDFTFFLLRFA